MPTTPDPIPSWQLCRGCSRNKISVVLSPCNHLAACGSCYSSMRTCPVCSRPVGSHAVKGVSGF